jgi:diaminopimelate epimerase
VGDVEFWKGHGTENDFVLLPDAAGALDLSPARVRALCDRHRGLGADGVLRVVRVGAVPDAPSEMDSEAWFMDYRNADGSIAEMCGNGARVFARYLAETGLARLGSFGIGTRNGVRPVTVHEDYSVTVDMGPASVFGTSAAIVGGAAFDGLAVDVGNPHLACVLSSDVDELDLTVPPGYDAALFPHGVNVEFLNVLDEESVRLRVYERGVGETRACGTGTVAGVAAVLRAGGRATGECRVHIPGGTVSVRVDEHTTMLSGPAELVAHGTLSGAWWDSADW